MSKKRKFNKVTINNNVLNYPYLSEVAPNCETAYTQIPVDFEVLDNIRRALYTEYCACYSWIVDNPEKDHRNILNRMGNLALCYSQVVNAVSWSTSDNKYIDKWSNRELEAAEILLKHASILR